MSTEGPVRVRTVMQTRFVVVDGMETVQDALIKIREHGATTLIVRKRHDDDEYGLVLLSDIAKQVLAHDRSPDRVNVYEIMSKPVVSVAPDMDIRYCARLFERFGLSTAPVINGGEVIGMVTYDELVLNGLWHSSGE